MLIAATTALWFGADERRHDGLVAYDVLIAATTALWFGTHLLGWAPALLVIALAAVNLLFGFCTGCFIFFQLQRLGLWK